jgi:hypothetical protein
VNHEFKLGKRSGAKKREAPSDMSLSEAIFQIVKLTPTGL